MKTWFTCRASDGEGDISIYDEIGMWGISAKDFETELKALGKVQHINVSINSPGGSVFDGVAIHNMLKRHKASVTVRVDGIAASIASVIAMAGDTILMPENAMMMIHDPSGIVVGTSQEMRTLADALDKIKKSIVSVYAARTGRDHDEISQIMSDETWLSAAEAVELGFADAVEEAVQMAASFDLSKFRNAPAEAGRERGPAAVTNADREEIPMDSTEPAIQPEETAGQETAPVETVATPEATTEPAEQIEARATTRALDIIAACSLAGKPDKAAEFIKAGISQSEVLAKLQAERPQSPEIVNRQGTSAPANAATWDKAVERQNSRLGR